MEKLKGPITPDKRAKGVIDIKITVYTLYMIPLTSSVISCLEIFCLLGKRTQAHKLASKDRCQWQEAVQYTTITPH